MSCIVFIDVEMFINMMCILKLNNMFHTSFRLLSSFEEFQSPTPSGGLANVCERYHGNGLEMEGYLKN